MLYEVGKDLFWFILYMHSVLHFTFIKNKKLIKNLKLKIIEIIHYNNNKTTANEISNLVNYCD